jgi:Na+/melibiose symporter-like transporter
MRKGVILPLMGLEEIFEMCVYGLRRVIPAEINNEAMDYCEWKNGYRSEAMTGVTMSTISKIQQAVMSFVTNIVMDKIGYIQGKEVGTQSDMTKWWIFALGTGIPIITSSLGIIPKFFYPLSAKTREKMYKDLFERRSKKAALIANATGKDLEEIAKNEF